MDPSLTIDDGVEAPTRTVEQEPCQFGSAARYLRTKSLAKEQRKAVGEDIACVQFEWPTGKPRVDYLRGTVWEFRSSLDNRIAQTLFAVESGLMVSLHGFKENAARARFGH